MNFHEKLTAARFNLYLFFPFFAYIMYRLPLKVADAETIARFRIPPGKDTAFTDGRSIYFCPDFLASLTSAELQGVMAHEVAHVVFLHHLRCGHRDPEIWNIAGDIVINKVLLDNGLTLPKGGLHTKALPDLAKYAPCTVEEVYDDLMKNAKNPESPSWGYVVQPEGHNGQSLSPAEQAQAEQDLKLIIGEATLAAKLAGKLPAGFERMIDSLLEPQLDWKSVLQQLLTNNLPTDYTWLRPSRRSLSADIHLPGFLKESLGTVALIIDTSGSKSVKQLQKDLGEINDIISNCHPSKVYVIYCDSEIQRVDEYGPGEDISLSLPGGGGTDFRPPFAWLDQQGIEPACAIYFTDLYCSDYPPVPTFPVMFCTDTPDATAPFGLTLRIS